MWSVLHTVNSATYIYTLFCYTIISLPLFFFPCCFRGSCLEKVSSCWCLWSDGIRKRQLQFYSSSSSTSLHLQSIFPGKGTRWILLKDAQNEMWPPLRENTVSVSLLAVYLCAAALCKQSRWGLVSPLQNCRWSFFLTSLFIIMSTKFDQSSSCFKNGRRQTLFPRAVLCLLFSISFLADQDLLKLCISSH